MFTGVGVSLLAVTMTMGAMFMNQVCVQVGPRPGKRGRPPKHPVQSQDEGQPEPGGVPEGEPEPPSMDTEAAEDVQNEGAGGDPEAAAPAPTPTEKTPAGGAVAGEHTCADCGMSFERRYSLIMHTLKHEKSRGYKCNVSIRRPPPTRGWRPPCDPLLPPPVAVSQGVPVRRLAAPSPGPAQAAEPPGGAQQGPPPAAPSGHRGRRAGGEGAVAAHQEGVCVRHLR